jgi:hypothetical protein
MAYLTYWWKTANSVTKNHHPSIKAFRLAATDIKVIFSHFPSQFQDWKGAEWVVEKFQKRC